MNRYTIYCVHGEWYKADEVDSRIADLERQLEELREAVRNMLARYDVMAPDMSFHVKARTEVERLLKGEE